MLRNPTLISASPGASEENVAAALESAGFEVNKEEKPPVTETEPQRDAFESDEAYESAVEEFKIAQANQESEEIDKEVEEDEREEKREEERAPKKSKFAKRIEKFTRPLQTKISELESRLAEKEKGGKAEEKETPVDPNPRPVRSAFGTVEEYEDALLAWGVDRMIETRSAKEIADEQKAQAQDNYDTYKTGVEEFAAEHDDWEEVMNQDIPIHPDVNFAIFELREKGAAVAYYLGKHPDLAQKLAKMPVRSAVMEVGRLSAKLEAASGPGPTAAGGRDNTQPRRRVPVPVKPVNTSATSHSLSSQEAAKKGDFKAFKKAQRAGR